MLHLFRSCPRIIAKRQSKTCTYTTLLPLSSHSSSICNQRGFSSTTSSQKDEIEVERLPNEKTPWLLLKPEIDKDTGDKLERFYSPGDNRLVKINREKHLRVSNSARCVASTLGGWLGYANSEDASLWLSNPYTNEVYPLPPLTNLPSVVSREYENYRVISVREECRDFSGDDSDNNIRISKPRDLVDRLSNLALSGFSPRSSRAAVAIVGDPKRLVYCHINKIFHYLYRDSDGEEEYDGTAFGYLEWLGLQEDYRPGESYHQAAYSCEAERFYTIFRNTGILVHDLENNRGRRSKMVMDFPMQNIESELKKAAENWENAKLKALDDDSHKTHYYLVPCGKEDLLLLVRHYRQGCSDSGFTHHETLHFDVFEVDFRWKKLKKVLNLGHWCAFVGLNQTFTSAAAGLKPNCIYFSDDICGKVNNSGSDCGIFNLSDNTILPLGYEEKDKVPVSDYCTLQVWVAPNPSN